MNERISTNPEFISKVVVSSAADGNALHGGDVDGSSAASTSGLISSTAKFGGGGGGSAGGGGSSSGGSSSSLGNRASNSNIAAFNL